jgi:hypothetical protein
MLPRAVPAVLACSVLLLTVARAAAQSTTAPFDRLPSHVFDVTPPTARVAGLPGSMSIRPGACRSLSLADVRQRIVELAVQEWGYFGFPVVEYDADDDEPNEGRGRVGGGDGRNGGPGGGRGSGPGGRGRGPSRIGTPEAARTAASIGGYWAVTPGGAWILENQNQYWRDAISGVTRWRFPWSAAFISWLMCEGGVAAPEQFQRAIAHHTYIDQAIRARDGAAPRAVYVAHDVGEAAVAPGDMLCTSRQPEYRALGERRRQMGQGARTHCDLVVKVDEAAARILAIGGNVRGVVGLKVIPAARVQGRLQPVLPSSARPVFAHLAWRGTAAPAALTAFDRSPTLRALACEGLPALTTPQTATLRRLVPAGARCAD